MFSGKRLVPFQEFAPEAQMTHNSIHGEHPVQKAGQAVGAALPLPRSYVGELYARHHLGTQLEPVSAVEVSSDDAVRVAGGFTLAQKASTAALASFRFGVFPNQRRAPRHPGGQKKP
jgi:hypothetical protein